MWTYQGKEEEGQTHSGRRDVPMAWLREDAVTRWAAWMGKGDIHDPGKRIALSQYVSMH